MRSVRRAKGIGHVTRNAGIHAEQNAGKERRGRVGQNRIDGRERPVAERVERGEEGIALIARDHSDTAEPDQRVDALAREVILV